MAALAFNFISKMVGKDCHDFNFIFLIKENHGRTYSK